MSDFITFHKSVMGYLHEQKQKPCQDCSGDYNGEEEGKPYYIAVIADGHGSSACPRSQVGSEKIVEIVLEDFKEFARTMLKEQEEADGSFGIYEQFAIPGCQKQMMKTLTDSIISKWKKAVRDHLNTNPLSEEELEKSGEFYAEQYRRGEHLEHLYGTTVIAALRLPDYLVLIQQGDGRCDVFYEDNTVNQPIPWDPRCHENITTSMCDVDVLQSIRSKVILLKEKSVIACYMGSDGVEDSYIDSSLEKTDEHYMEGTHMFYRDITCQLLDSCEKSLEKEEGKGKFEEFLKKRLPEFSETGSGDDVSVSGIVDLEKAKQFKEAFEKDVKRYNLQNDLRKWEEKLGSMERKYRILKERSEQIQSKQENAKRKSEKIEEIKRLEEEIKALEDKKNQIEEDKKEFKKRYDKLKRERERCNTKTKIMELYEKYSIPTIKLSNLADIEKWINHLLGFYNDSFKNNSKELIEKQKELNRLNLELEGKIIDKQKAMKLFAEAENVSAQQEFEEYDEQYKKVKEEIKKIKNEISSL